MKLNLFVIACRQITTSSTRSATAVAPGGGWLFPTRPWSALDYLIPWEGRNAVCCDFSFYRLLLLFCAMYISRGCHCCPEFPWVVLPLQPSFLPAGDVEQGLSVQCIHERHCLLQVPLYADSQTRHISDSTPWRAVLACLELPCSPVLQLSSHSQLYWPKWWPPVLRLYLHCVHILTISVI